MLYPQITEKRMRLHPVTLLFADQPETESNFRKQYFRDSLPQFRFAFLLLTILYAGFSIVDYLYIPDRLTTFLLIRFGIVLPLMAGTLFFSYSNLFEKVWQGLLTLCYVVSGAGISYMLILEPENFTYYGGLMLVFAAGYFFIQLRFLYASIAGWITLILFIAGKIIAQQTFSELLVISFFFFTAMNLIGMFGSYYLEYYARRNFHQHLQSQQQQNLLNETFQNRENEINQRTLELKQKNNRLTHELERGRIIEHELIRVKEKAEESDRLKTAFLTNLSHELRTPLNSIIGFAYLLSNDDIEPEERTEYQRIIHQQSDYMLSQINDIVEISKIESGQYELDFIKCSIPDICGDVLEVMKKQLLPEVNLVIDEKSEKQLIPTIKTDCERLIQILKQLISNAIKYTQQGEIRIGYGLNSRERLLEFYVSDTGIGISEENRQKIFKRFTKLDPFAQGTGLGLSICKALIEQMGGNIDLESSPGNGTTFRFNIPYAPVETTVS